MKLKIRNKDYQRLALKPKKPIIAVAINDYVSTSRKDAAGIAHEYESRHSLMGAFMFASKSKVVSLVCDYSLEPIRARVTTVGGVVNDGLGFTLELAQEAK